MTLNKRLDGRIERICEHGVGHTIGHVRGWLREAESIHGCDGCCSNYNTQPEHEGRRGRDTQPDKGLEGE